MSITFTDPQANDVTFTNNQVEYPYTSRIVFPWTRVNKSGGNIDFWDEGSTYDKYQCECTFLLDATQMQTFTNFLSVDDSSNARGDTLTLSISGGGFFPFSPLRGDGGPFTVEVTKVVQTGSFISGPYKHYRITLTLANAGSWPSYSLPSEVNQGDFGIGTVTNMRFPPGGFTQEINYKVGVIHTAGTQVYKNDWTATSDHYNNSFNLNVNQSKMAAMLNYMVNTGRDGDVTITAGSDNYPFGRQKGASGTFTARLITRSLEVVHTNFDEFSCQMGWQWRS